MAVPPDNWIKAPSTNSSDHIGEGVIIDIGTGDGRFVYQCARENPNKFYIGIEPNVRPLEKISEKIHRKPAKGGAPNVIFIKAAIEDLPAELNSVADEIHIHFPWGSLLKAIATGDESVLRALHRIGTPGCLLEVVIGIDANRDRAEIERLKLRPISLAHVEAVLAPQYEAAGFRVIENGVVSAADWSRLHTSWARRLKMNDRREVVYFVAEARK